MHMGANDGRRMHTVPDADALRHGGASYTITQEAKTANNVLVHERPSVTDEIVRRRAVSKALLSHHDVGEVEASVDSILHAERPDLFPLSPQALDAHPMHRTWKDTWMKAALGWGLPIVAATSAGYATHALLKNLRPRYAYGARWLRVTSVKVNYTELNLPVLTTALAAAHGRDIVYITRETLVAVTLNDLVNKNVYVQIPNVDYSYIPYAPEPYMPVPYRAMKWKIVDPPPSGIALDGCDELSEKIIAGTLKFSRREIDTMCPVFTTKVNWNTYVKISSTKYAKPYYVRDSILATVTSVLWDLKGNINGFVGVWARRTNTFGASTAAKQNIATPLSHVIAATAAVGAFAMTRHLVDDATLWRFADRKDVFCATLVVATLAAYAENDFDAGPAILEETTARWLRGVTKVFPEHDPDIETYTLVIKQLLGEEPLRASPLPLRHALLEGNVLLSPHAPTEAVDVSNHEIKVLKAIPTLRKA